LDSELFDLLGVVYDEVVYVVVVDDVRDLVVRPGYFG